MNVTVEQRSLRVISSLDRFSARFLFACCWRVAALPAQRGRQKLLSPADLSIITALPDPRPPPTSSLLPASAM